uniref:Uncharacterized protein n=1 Tax=Setaria viridis TaxID=4556 RepID=A0A4U6UIY0_SETVI|nr:hypothetical protein SEVIR_5G183100v2 [Setaria viridis]
MRREMKWPRLPLICRRVLMAHTERHRRALRSLSRPALPMTGMRHPHLMGNQQVPPSAPHRPIPIALAHCRCPVPVPITFVIAHCHRPIPSPSGFAARPRVTDHAALFLTPSPIPNCRRPTLLTLGLVPNWRRLALLIPRPVSNRHRRSASPSPPGRRVVAPPLPGGAFLSRLLPFPATLCLLPAPPLHRWAAVLRLLPSSCDSHRGASPYYLHRR